STADAGSAETVMNPAATIPSFVVKTVVRRIACSSLKRIPKSVAMGRSNMKQRIKTAAIAKRDGEIPFRVALC
ncbi:MAG: hypothetical protein JJ992_28760, partial [Planctomycetes bacterium]|nr:hypothetical protein [Planctomycetota bacterium]